MVCAVLGAVLPNSLPSYGTFVSALQGIAVLFRRDRSTVAEAISVKKKKKKKKAPVIYDCQSSCESRRGVGGGDERGISCRVWPHEDLRRHGLRLIGLGVIVQGGRRNRKESWGPSLGGDGFCGDNIRLQPVNYGVGSYEERGRVCAERDLPFQSKLVLS